VHNIGGCSAGGAPTANTLSSPAGVDADATGIYIADAANNRVLFFPRQ
jgi:hypothetical protein